MSDFRALLHRDNECVAVPRVPVIRLTQEGRAGFFDDAGYPVSAGRSTTDFTNLGDANACALKICRRQHETCLLRRRCVIVYPNAVISPGDRVVAKTYQRLNFHEELVKMPVSEVRIASINAAHSQIVYCGSKWSGDSRIVWVGQ